MKYASRSVPLPATLAGRYEIRARVGAGGMGAVYKGMDALTKAPVAIKVASYARGGQGGQLAREASVLSELRHPHLVAYLGFGSTDSGGAFLVMEWLEGEDLAARLARGPLDIASVLALGAKVAGALAFVHARGIIHRDLKPSNLFLPGGDVDRVKIIDLGLARADRTTPPADVGVVGTQLYMAPEQARGDRAIGPSADLFSLGCTLYECLTGRPPFAADHALAVAAKVLFEDPAPPRALRDDIPEELEALVLDLLAKEPAQRPGDASTVAEILGRIAQGPESLRRPSLTDLEKPLRPSIPEGGLPSLPDERPRALLGKPTPCVGRDREIASLVALFEECIEEPAARAVLVTGPAGIGKSRLRIELVRALRDRAPTAEVWLARGDPRGSPYHLLAQVLRQAAGMALGDGPEARARKLSDRVTRRGVGPHEAYVIEVLAEVASAPVPSSPSPLLLVACEDPAWIAGEIRRAFEAFVRVACEGRPIALVLDDVHAADLPSLKVVSAMLQGLASAPLFVLLLARPEIDRELVGVFRARGVHEVRLGVLGKRACERIARDALGPSVGEDRIARLVDRSGGNAFFLEELICAEAEGGRDLPESVLTILQERLASLPEPERRLLRAASVFGETFTERGVLALLGGDEARSPEIRAWISDLIEREILILRGSGGAPGEVEYAFRHGLLRDAAYATLVEDDRRVGHRLAAEHLLALGSTEALVLAMHFEQAGEPRRAARLYAQAAEKADGPHRLR
ncbi:MAG TPA: protein kinase [Polyangiaceae bacterium]|nr:protein kinase [Polyangiaceae bacterium]